ncbi:LysR family transcriptional regulator [Sphingopyxis sp. KK2]|uniref:LysR family transcriptional regulator n=1 Tax=Sphingopyxis sp. KK2 TaxID=1855727 RepID=UPI00097E662D|nr:LysR family transcriptional regulator [Sphingopyxis sp. KK2]
MHHLDFKLLRSFAAVASEMSVTRAAEKLHLTQPTVSGQIKELETTLGFLLFHRTSRRVTLSEQGAALLPKVAALLALADEVRHDAESMQHATVTHFRLGAAMYTMDFADRISLLDAFAAARPDIRYSIDNRLQTDQVRDLLTEKLDAALLLGIAAGIPAAEFLHEVPSGLIVNEVQYPDALERVLLCRRKIGLLVPEASELAAMDVITGDALAGRRIAMLSGEHGDAFINPMVSFMLSRGAIPLAPSEGNALAIERYALRSGHCCIGIGWFPTPTGLVFRPVEDMDFFMDFSVVLGTAPNKAARRFFDYAERWQAAREAAGESVERLPIGSFG